MIGTLINVATVLVGTVLGVLIGGRLPERIRETVFHGLGLLTLVLGVDNALAAFRPPLTELTQARGLVVVGAVLVGGVIGEAVGIERGLDRLGEFLRTRFGRGQERFTEGFVVASLLFCVGPLAILGSIRDGLTGDYQLLAVKAALDGFAAMAFASALGWGVGFSALVVLVYQGGLSLGASVFAGVLADPADPIIAGMTAAGGVLIMGIALRLLDLRQVRVANFLPALVLAPAAFAIIDRMA